MVKRRRFAGEHLQNTCRYALRKQRHYNNRADVQGATSLSVNPGIILRIVGANRKSAAQALTREAALAHPHTNFGSGAGAGHAYNVLAFAQRYRRAIGGGE